MRSKFSFLNSSMTCSGFQSSQHDGSESGEAPQDLPSPARARSCSAPCRPASCHWRCPCLPRLPSPYSCPCRVVLACCSAHPPRSRLHNERSGRASRRVRTGAVAEVQGQGPRWTVPLILIHSAKMRRQDETTELLLVEVEGRAVARSRRRLLYPSRLLPLLPSLPLP